MPTPRKATTAPALSIKHNGETLPFKLGTNEWCEIEDREKKGFMEVVADLGDKPSFRMLRLIVALGLSTKEVTYSEAEAGEIISAIGLPETVKIISASVNALVDGKAA